MKKILLVLIALCFVFVGTFESFSQKRAVTPKSSKRKLVKCRVKGKTVYRTRCRTAKPTEPVIALTNPDLVVTGGQGVGNGRGTGQGSGMGNGAGSGSGNTDPENNVKPESNKQRNLQGDQNLKIISQPRAAYTDLARQNQIQGKVSLKVTFLANGSVGEIVPISGLSDGLTEQAVNAARLIKFEPAKRGGVPYTVVKILSYSFTLY